MKITYKLFSLLCLGALLMFTTSCSDDDVVIDGGGGDGINVSDGLYLALSGEDPSSTAQMVSEVVEDEGFAAQERAGFVSGYMYLEAGQYNVVQVESREVTATIGGASTSVTDEGSSCDYNSYTVVSTEADGAAFTVANSGLYKVSHDQMKSELVMYQIAEANIIGSSTPGGWGADTPLTPSISSDGATWSAEGVVLRAGEWKVRFNCRWSIDRRDDSGLPLTDAANGYQMFTNFGGTTNSLETGGANIAQSDEGTYTITVSWDPRDGFSLVSERTGDAPAVTFNPDDFRMAVIGDATANSWDADRNLVHSEANGVHTWHGVVTLAETGEFKFRANDEWNFDLGGDPSALSIGGNNIASPGAGSYYIALTTPDEGDTWSASITPGGWGVIGDGSPQGNWDADLDMNADGFVDGITTYSITGDFNGEWKIRAGDDWALNLGGDLTALTPNGNNLNTAAGTYTLTLSFDGDNYSATIN